MGGIFEALKDDLFTIAAVTLAAIVRAMGVTIQSGQTGLLFSFGRARRELHPGFHILIPFLQRARRMPTRSRSLDLPAQRVATFEGLVYHVDANLVYRVVDVRKAMIEVDHLEKGMIQMLGLAVQDVLRSATREQVTHGESLDSALAVNMARRLAPWGVEVERAGFPSITPSPRSLRITQLRQVTGERRETFRRMRAAELDPGRAAGLIGTRSMPRSRTRALRRFENARRRRKRLRAGLKQRGWTAVQIKQAMVSIHSRTTVRGKSRAISK